MRKIIQGACAAMKPLGFIALALLAGCGSLPQAGPEPVSVKTFTVSLANIHVIDAGGKRLMIDAGKHGDEPRLLAAMRKEGIDPRSIDYLILTHGHTDHAGGAQYFKEHFGTPILAGKADQPMLSSGRNGTLCPTGVLARFLKPSIERESYPPVSADIWVEDAFDLAQLGVAGEVLVAPSHTPGSLVVIMDDKAFVGDLVRGQLIGKTRPARHFYMCGREDNDRDILRLLEARNIETWYTGHMGPVSADAVSERFEP